MSSISNVAANELALLLFNNTNITDVGDATGLRGSSSAGVYYLCGHTADPTDAGDATSNELAYTGYARAAVARSASGWTVSGRNVENFADIVFPTSGSVGPETMSHWSLCKEISGASTILFKGSLVSSLVIGLNVAPRVTAGSLDIIF